MTTTIHASINHERTRLTSERLSPCRNFSFPMEGCSGPVVLTWVRLPLAGVSFLVAVTPVTAGAA